MPGVTEPVIRKGDHVVLAHGYDRIHRLAGLGVVAWRRGTHYKVRWLTGTWAGHDWTGLGDGVTRVRRDQLRLVTKTEIQAHLASHQLDQESGL